MLRPVQLVLHRLHIRFRLTQLLRLRDPIGDLRAHRFQLGLKALNLALCIRSGLSRCGELLISCLGGGELFLHDTEGFGELGVEGGEGECVRRGEGVELCFVGVL